MAEPNKTNKERLKDITDGIEQGIKDLFQSDKYTQYLGIMSRFHRYSVNNTMLIFMQKPNATLVAGYLSYLSNKYPYPMSILILLLFLEYIKIRGNL